MNHPTTSSLPVTSPTSCSREALDVEGLAAVVDPAVQMVTWDRPTDAVVSQFARSVLAEEAFEVRSKVAAAEIDEFDLIPDFAREAAPEAAELFADDVRSLMKIFADLTAASTVGFRLIRLDKAMCPRFHADYIPVRLLVTYSGQGSEWLADAEVDRDRLGAASGGLADGESGVMRPGAVIRQVPEQTVALLKGKTWFGNESKGAVHRSPALRDGERRVLLSLDVVD